MEAAVLVNTHMSKVFVTPLTHCFSVLLLPWKQRSHGNKRCQFLGEGRMLGGWVGGGGDKVGVLLSKSGPALNEAVGVLSMQMKERRRKTCCPRDTSRIYSLRQKHIKAHFYSAIKTNLPR